jgi:DNA-binding transcriptional regulator of glucitol operon
MRLARLFVSAAVLIAALVAVWPAAAAPSGQDQPALITSPRDGAQLTGVIQITGNAFHAKFHHYELAWALQSAPEDWQMIASVNNQITNNGSLGTWDTSQLQSGTYRLRLRVVRDDDKTVDSVVNNLSINQGTPTPAASPTPGSGATPTVVVVQPPTSTPQVVATARPGAAAVATAGGPRTPSIQVNPAGFGQAFCNGALYTFLIFTVWGIVVGVREIARWALRQARRPPLPKE